MRNVAIDRLRGIAVIMILFCHAPGLSTFKFNCGVHLFFVISGFLVTNSLYRISVKEFFSRRFAKIMPSSVVWLVVPFVFFSSVSVVEVWKSVSFRHNYLGHLMIAHYWSLLIEWQFYLVMPVIFALGGRLKTFAAILSGLVLYRWFAVSHEIFVYSYLNTEFRIDSILCGVLLALFLKRFPRTISIPSFLNWGVLLAGLLFYMKGENFLPFWIIQPILNLFWVALVYFAAVSHKQKPNSISFMGKRCLSFYLVNNPISLTCPSVVAYVCIVFVLAVLNYQFVESRFV